MVQNREEIRRILQEAKRIAVVGLSDNPYRTSHQVSRYMQQAGYDIFPVNPNISAALGVQAYPTLQDVPETVDIVNVFRQSHHTPDVAKAAVEIGAGTLWLQLGIQNDEAERIAEEGGLHVIMNRCIQVEHQM